MLVVLGGRRSASRVAAARRPRAGAWGGATLALLRRPGRADLRLDRLVGAARVLLAGGQPHAVLLRPLSPSRWRWPAWRPALAGACVGGVALYALVVCGYALLAKVFPASLDPGDALGRLGVPFDYYNATGLVAAMGIPAVVWLGRPARASARAAPGCWPRAQRAGARRARLHARPLLRPRSARPRSIVGLAVWFVLAPGAPARRARARPRGARRAPSGAVGDRARRRSATTTSPLARATAAGHRFGSCCWSRSGRPRRRGRAGRGGPGARPPAPEAAPARSASALIVARGAHPGRPAWRPWPPPRADSAARSRTCGPRSPTPTASSPTSPSRLAELGSSRPRTGSDGLRVGDHAPLAGTGAFGFAAAALPLLEHRVHHAHSYVIQTFADFGVDRACSSARRCCAPGCWRCGARCAAPSRPSAEGRRARAADAERRAGHAARHRGHLRRALGHRLDVVHPRRRRAGAAGARAGWPAAAR